MRETIAKTIIIAFALVIVFIVEVLPVLLREWNMVIIINLMIWIPAILAWALVETNGVERWDEQKQRWVHDDIDVD